MEVEAAAVARRRLLVQLEGFRLPELVELVHPGQSFPNCSYSLDRQNGIIHSITPLRLVKRKEKKTTHTLNCHKKKLKVDTLENYSGYVSQQ